MCPVRSVTYVSGRSPLLEGPLHVRQHCWTSVDFFGIWRYLNFRARYPSGKGEVCKTFMRRFDSDPRLHRYFLYFQVTNSNITYFVGVAGLRRHAASTSSNRTKLRMESSESTGVNTPGQCCKAQAKHCSYV